MTSLYIFLLLCGFNLFFCVFSLNNGLARTPPMGWLTWERYQCQIDCKVFPDACVDEHLIRTMADQMSVNGWLDSGYHYIMIDDCWLAKTRDSKGLLQPDSQRFPNGMKTLIDYVHSKGLLFGIYEDFGDRTCAGYPGSLGHLKEDAETFASWGVDYVKLDGCNSDGSIQPAGFQEFGIYLNKTGRPMVYNCLYLLHQPDLKKVNSSQLQENCNLWRVYNDIFDDWNSVFSVIQFMTKNYADISTWAGPGHWNDPDMLVIGNYGLTHGQEQAQMAFWCLFAAPLIMSTDLTKISDSSRRILMNTLAIAINQDALGIPGKFIDNYSDRVTIYNRELSYDGYAVILFASKPGTEPSFANVTLRQMGISGDKPGIIGYHFIDVFEYKSLGSFTFNDKVSLFVNPWGGVRFLHGTALYKNGELKFNENVLHGKRNAGDRGHL